MEFKTKDTIRKHNKAVLYQDFSPKTMQGLIQKSLASLELKKIWICLSLSVYCLLYDLGFH